MMMVNTNALMVSRFNKIAIQGTPQMAPDKELLAYRESTHTILSVSCLYFKCIPPVFVYSVLEHINIHNQLIIYSIH